MTFKEAKENVMIEDILTKLGSPPPEDKIGKPYYMMTSAFNPDERTASMRVTTTKNIFFDNSSGKSGNNIDLVREMLKLGDKHDKQANNKAREWIRDMSQMPDVKRVVRTPDKERKSVENPNILIKAEPLKNRDLIDYVTKERKLPMEIASAHLQDVYYKRISAQGVEHRYYAVGMKNDNGGYDVRNKMDASKTVIGNYGITTLKGNKPDGRVDIFEGRFDFLAKNAMLGKNEYRDTIIANSANHYKDVAEKISRSGYKEVALYHDNDRAGHKFNDDLKEHLKSIGAAHVKVYSRAHLYEGHKDINDMWKEKQQNMFQLQTPGTSVARSLSSALTQATQSAAYKPDYKKMFLESQKPSRQNTSANNITVSQSAAHKIK